MLPRFELLTKSSETQPLFTIRPAKRGESVPSPFGNIEGSDSWVKSHWILEVVPNQSASLSGMVVRRDWLGTVAGKVGADTAGGITVEALLVNLRA